jgi:hypothetical protein
MYGTYANVCCDSPDTHTNSFATVETKHGCNGSFVFSFSAMEDASEEDEKDRKDEDENENHTNKEKENRPQRRLRRSDLVRHCTRRNSDSKPVRMRQGKRFLAEPHCLGYFLR